MKGEKSKHVGYFIKIRTNDDLLLLPQLTIKKEKINNAYRQFCFSQMDSVISRIRGDFQTAERMQTLSFSLDSDSLSKALQETLNG